MAKILAEAASELCSAREDLHRTLSARARFNVAHFKGPVSIVGDFDLRSDDHSMGSIAKDFPSAGPDFSRNRYGSFFLQPLCHKILQLFQ